jgi:hypothetical protein
MATHACNPLDSCIDGIALQARNPAVATPGAQRQGRAETR